MKKLKDVLLSEGPWPLIAIFAIGGILFTLILLFAPPGVREMLFGANGLVMAVLTALVRSPLHGLPEDGDDDAEK